MCFATIFKAAAAAAAAMTVEMVRFAAPVGVEDESRINARATPSHSLAGATDSSIAIRLTFAGGIAV